MEVRGVGCCGVREINSLSSHRTPKEAMQAFCAHRLGGVKSILNMPIYDRWGNYTGRSRRRVRITPGDKRFGVAMFTQAWSPGDRPKVDPPPLYGDAFAEFITEHGLGEVTSTRPHRNPNTGRTIQVWTWAIKPLVLAKWWKANKR